MQEIEIPEAIREDVELAKKSRPVPLRLIITAVFCLGVGGLLFMLFFSPKKTATVKPQAKPQPSAKAAPQPQPSPIANPIIPAPVEADALGKEKEKGKAKPAKDNLLGHLPYSVAPPETLISVTGDGLMMRANAAAKFQQMQAAAQADGVSLVAISAFRSADAQEELFFGVKEQRVQDAAKRAEVSAPPGYSEHHTGYAVDIGDGDVPSTNVEDEFANTAAFRWLEQNALKYSFELSFPPDNEQGVSYEPWHWRFVGDRHSLETFYKVRN